MNSSASRTNSRFPSPSSSSSRSPPTLYSKPTTRSPSTSSLLISRQNDREEQQQQEMEEKKMSQLERLELVQRSQWRGGGANREVIVEDNNLLSPPILQTITDTYLVETRQHLFHYNATEWERPQDLSNYIDCVPATEEQSTDCIYNPNFDYIFPRRLHYYRQDAGPTYTVEIEGPNKIKVLAYKEYEFQAEGLPPKIIRRQYNELTDWYRTLEVAKKPWISKWPKELLYPTTRVHFELPFQLLLPELDERIRGKFTERPTLLHLIKALRSGTGHVRIPITRDSLERYINKYRILGQERFQYKWFLVHMIQITSQVSQNIPFDLNIQLVSNNNNSHFSDKKWISYRGPSMTPESELHQAEPRAFTVFQNTKIEQSWRTFVYRCEQEIYEHPEFTRWINVNEEETRILLGQSLQSSLNQYHIRAPLHGGVLQPENCEQWVDDVVRYVALDEWMRIKHLSTMRQAKTDPKIVGDGAAKTFVVDKAVMDEIINQKFELFGKERHCINLLDDPEPIILDIKPELKNKDVNDLEMFLNTLEKEKEATSLIHFRVTFLIQGEFISLDKKPINEIL